LSNILSTVTREALSTSFNISKLSLVCSLKKDINFRADIFFGDLTMENYGYDQIFNLKNLKSV
jgi:hypothetical protein